MSIRRPILIAALAGAAFAADPALAQEADPAPAPEADATWEDANWAAENAGADFDGAEFEYGEYPGAYGPMPHGPMPMGPHGPGMMGPHPMWQLGAMQRSYNDEERATWLRECRLRYADGDDGPDADQDFCGVYLARFEAGQGHGAYGYGYGQNVMWVPVVVGWHCKPNKVIEEEWIEEEPARRVIPPKPRPVKGKIVPAKPIKSTK